MWLLNVKTDGQRLADELLNQRIDSIMRKRAVLAPSIASDKRLATAGQPSASASSQYVYAVLATMCAPPGGDPHRAMLQVVVRFDNKQQLELEDENRFADTYGSYKSGLLEGWAADGTLGLGKTISAQVAQIRGFVVFDRELRP